MIRLLFYVDPALLFEQFVSTATVLNDHLLQFCGEALKKSGKFELKAVVSEIGKWEQESGQGPFGLELVVIPMERLRAALGGLKSLDAMRQAFFTDALDEAARIRFATLLEETLGGWKPDIILSYPTAFTPLQRVFPEALCLVMENGLFSRFPFPRALRFDSVGFLHGFPNRHAEEIRNFPVTDSQREQVSSFRSQLNALIDRYNPYLREIGEMRRRYRRLVLCPVPVANFYGEAAFDDQYVWLTNLMERMPRDIGVIATFHDSLSAQLNARTSGYFASRYPNLVFFQRPGVGVASFWFFPHVDAILNCETMTGLQGLLSGPRVISLDRSYSDWFSQGRGIESLEAALDVPPEDRDGLIFWTMTRFMVFARRFDDADWYANYFANKLSRYRAGETGFDFYDKIEDFGEVAEWLLLEAEENLKKEESRRRALRQSVLRKVGKRIVKVGEWFLRQGEL